MNFIDLNVLIVHIRSQKAADAPSYSLISSVFLLLPMNLAASARQIWRDSQRDLSLFLLERYEEKGQLKLEVLSLIILVWSITCSGLCLIGGEVKVERPASDPLPHILTFHFL